MEHLYELMIFKDKIMNKKIVQLENTLMAFSRITNTPVTYFSSVGKEQWTTLQDKKICAANSQYGNENFDCTRNLMSSMRISLSLPDVYIFMCNAGLINLCYALMMDTKVYGFLIAGPIAMGNDVKKIISTLLSSSLAEAIDYSRLMTLVRELKLYAPKEITYLSTLFQSAITASLEIHHTSEIKYQRHQEQSDIGNKLIQMNKAHLNIDYPYHAENKLVDIIKSGSIDICKKQFSIYMEELMTFESGNLSMVKLRLIAFFTQLMKSDDDWQKNYKNFFSLKKMNEAQNLAEITEAGATLTAALAKSTADKVYSGSSPIIKKVITYINLHYCNNISLKSVAETIHVNCTYLSTLFKRELGISFVAYLNSVRLAHAEELLNNSALTVTEVCLSTGFSSSSYFTKLFKAKNGTTPNEFRRHSQ